MVALGRVVVDDVEDHLDARLVQRLHHQLEVGHLLAVLAAVGVLVVGREEVEGVVAPVVAQSPLEQVRVVGELVDGQQLEGGDAERSQVLDEGRVGDAGIGAAQFRVDVGMAHRGALHVGLVDHGVGPRHTQRLVLSPVEERVHHDAARRDAGAVAVVATVGIAERVAERRLVPVDVARDRAGVRVEQELVGVAPMAGGRVVRSVDPEAVRRAGVEVGQVAVPHRAGPLGERHAVLGAVGVEHAQLHRLGDVAEDGDVGAHPVEGGAERRR